MSGAEVKFPRVSQIVTSRHELVRILRDAFPEIPESPRIAILSGGRSTKAFAAFYKDVIQRQFSGVTPEAYELPNAPLQSEAEELAARLERRPPDLLAYIGGQTVADSAKWIARALRRQEGSRLVFGGIITALTGDGVFTDNASLRNNDGIPTSEAAVSPDFILGHRLTLLRQPFWMKTSCVGDVLAKVSSLWDYNYSCRALNKYHHDFAADLTHTAYESVLRANRTAQDSVDHDYKEYLFESESIDLLFRAVQLCGLSMQLTRNSETCSGSEHVGQKWLDEYTLRYNNCVKASPDRPLTIQSHGAAVAPMLLTTLHMQGQAARAREITRIFKKLDLPCNVDDIGVPATVFQICLVLGFGYRCPVYAAYLLGGSPVPTGDLREERVTVLEEGEFENLPNMIQQAMIDAEVARKDDFKPVGSNARIALQEVAHAVLARMRDRVTDRVGSVSAGMVTDRLKTLLEDKCPSLGRLDH